MAVKVDHEMHLAIEGTMVHAGLCPHFEDGRYLKMKGEEGENKREIWRTTGCRKFRSCASQVICWCKRRGPRLLPWCPSLPLGALQEVAMSQLAGRDIHLPTILIAFTQKLHKHPDYVKMERWRQAATGTVTWNRHMDDGPSGAVEDAVRRASCLSQLVMEESFAMARTTVFEEPRRFSWASRRGIEAVQQQQKKKTSQEMHNTCNCYHPPP